MRYKLFLDELPAAVVMRNSDTGQIKVDYDDGIPVGMVVNSIEPGKPPSKKFMLFNTFNMVVKLAPAP